MDVDPNTLHHSEAYKLLVGSIFPRPIAWVSTIDKNGETNLAPFSFFMGVCAKPLTIAFAPMNKPSGTKKDTLQNIKDTSQFVVNMVPESLVMKMNQTSADYPSGVSEFKEAGLTPLRSMKVEPPRVKESPINMECELHTLVSMGDDPGAGTIIVGRVIHYHCDDAYIHDGKLDLKKLELVGRLSGAWYARTVNDIFEVQRPLIPTK